MNSNKEKRIVKKRISRKTVIFLLLLLSFVMSSGTFAYWSGYVGGSFDSNNFSFTVGSYEFRDYDFILNSEGYEGEFIIDTETLVISKAPTGDDIDVYFGILWEDEDRVNEDGSVTKARIELSYEIYGEKDGKEYNKRKYTRIENLMEISFDENNSDFIELNGGTESFNMNISLIQDGSRNDYRLFGNSDIMIIVTYTIIYETIE